MSMNVCIFSGRLGREPELRYSQDGKAICKFSIAVDRRRKDEPPDWIDITCFDKLAELCNEFLGKGSKVTVQGRLQIRTWENKDGAKQRAFSIVAQEVDFGPKADASSKPAAERYGAADKPANGAKGADWNDIPF